MLFLSLLLSFSTVSAQYKGFNYGSTLTDGTAKSQAVFQAEFSAANALSFNSARLYTMIQAGTAADPILAIPAAIATDTTLLLGLWASAGQASFTNEISALTAAITKYGTQFTSRVVAISVGSEDLYRYSATGLASNGGLGNGIGTDPATLVSYIKQVKTALTGTALANVKITHVDTYDAFTNSSNSAIISAIDFISMDAYPYYQAAMANSVDNALTLFKTAYQETVAVAGGKDVWIAETGWPVSGSTVGAGVASVDNAHTYWNSVGCGFAFGKINTYWYILQDAIPTAPSPSFGIVGAGSVDGTPLFNLTCPASSAAAAVAVASSSSTKSSTSTTRSASPSRSSTSSSVSSSSSASSSSRTVSATTTSTSSSASTSSTSSSSSASSSKIASSTSTSSSTTLTSSSLSTSTTSTASAAAAVVTQASVVTIKSSSTTGPSSASASATVKSSGGSKYYVPIALVGFSMALSLL